MSMCPVVPVSWRPCALSTILMFKSPSLHLLHQLQPPSSLPLASIENLPALWCTLSPSIILSSTILFKFSFDKLIFGENESKTVLQNYAIYKCETFQYWRHCKGSLSRPNPLVYLSTSPPGVVVVQWYWAVLSQQIWCQKMKFSQTISVFDWDIQGLNLNFSTIFALCSPNTTSILVSSPPVSGVFSYTTNCATHPVLDQYYFVILLLW